MLGNGKLVRCASAGVEEDRSAASRVRFSVSRRAILFGLASALVPIPAAGAAHRPEVGETGSDFASRPGSLPGSPSMADPASFDSRVRVMVTTVDPAVTFLRTAGQTEPGDGGAALYRRAAVEPRHGWKIRSKDGAWWEYVPDAGGFYVLAAYGHVSDTDNANLLSAAVEGLPRQPAGILVLPEGVFRIARRCDCDLPDNWTVLAYGTNIVATHDGLAIRLNPAYDPSTNAGSDKNTKRNLRWFGGLFENGNAAKTASVAVQAYGMRGFVLEGTKFGNSPGSGFHAAVELQGKDSYTVRNNQFYDNIISLRIPGLTTTLGDKTVLVNVTGNHFSSAGMKHAVLVEDAVETINLWGNSTNGACLGGQIRFIDHGLAETRNISFRDHYAEQQDFNGAVVFSAPNGRGFRQVTFSGGHMSTATMGWRGIITDRVFGLRIDMRFNDGSGGDAEVAITLDPESRDIAIEDGATYNRQATRFSGVAVPVLLNGCARTDVRITPSHIEVPGIGIADGRTNLDPYVGASLSSRTIDMSAGALANMFLNMALAPVAYDVIVRAEKSGRHTAGTATGAGTGAGAWFRLRQPGGNAHIAVQVDLRGASPDDPHILSGKVLADAEGNILAEGVSAGTMTVNAYTLGVHR